ncbi:MAG: GCN5-related N-acetyltransferase [Pelosinus sp.]|jgi:GNAT superfamily N-acetyltransferase|nr:GCN5-related N-acetyltransferase [Pelosinus sp.]
MIDPDANAVDIDVTNEYEIKFLNEDHLDQILNLQGIVTKKLSDPTSYYVEPVEFFRKQLLIENSAIGFFHNHHLLGFNMATFPGLEEDNIGQSFGFEEKELLQVVQIGPAAVHPDYRNKKIFSKLAKEHLKVIEKLGYRHIFLTVAPNNYPTVRIFIDNDFTIKQLKIKFNNLLRYILHLDFKSRLKQPQYSVRIPNTDIESQKFIMSLGFYGYDLLKNDNGFDLIFGHDEIKA